MAKFELENIGGVFSLGGSQTAQDVYGEKGIFPVVSVIIKNLYVLVGIILLIMVFVGGLGLILNAGNAEAQKHSSKTLTSAVAGFAILIAAYWLVKIIEIIFGIDIFTL